MSNPGPKRNSKKLRQQIKVEACSRCGHLSHLEVHHKQSWAETHNDHKSNLVVLCKGCHDFQHAKEAIYAGINSERKRISVLEERLRILERENTPEFITKRGYQTYFTLFSEPIPLRNKCATR